MKVTDSDKLAEELQNRLNTHPNDCDAALQLADIYIRQNDHKSAVTVLDTSFASSNETDGRLPVKAWATLRAAQMWEELWDRLSEAQIARYDGDFSIFAYVLKFESALALDFRREAKEIAESLSRTLPQVSSKFPVQDPAYLLQLSWSLADVLRDEERAKFLFSLDYPKAKGTFRRRDLIFSNKIENAELTHIPISPGKTIELRDVARIIRANNDQEWRRNAERTFVHKWGLEYASISHDDIISSIKYRCAPQEILEIPEGRYVPGWDFALTKHGNVIGDSRHNGPARSGTYPHMYVADTNAIYHYSPSQEVRCSFKALLISEPPHHNYGHWWNDYIPRLQALRYLPEDTKAVIPPLHQNLFDVLKLIIPEDRIFLCTNVDAEYSFETLYFFKVGRFQMGNSRPSNIEFIRDRISSKILYSDNTPRRPVYISREDVGTRKVKNEKEVIEFLRNYGFQILRPLETTIDVQRRMLGTANILVAGHGSGLWGQVFCPPGCDVYSLLPDTEPLISNDPLCAQIFGHRFSYIYCNAEKGEKTKPGRNDLDLVVDINLLQQTLGLS